MHELIKKLELTLLGSPQVMIDRLPVTGFITSKAEALLYYLALTGRTHARSVLAGLFWPDVPEAVARKNLRDIIFNLRKLLGEYLLITRQTVAFNQQARYWLDVTQIRTLLHPHGETYTIQALQEAIALYQGDLLDGFYVRDAEGFEEWLRVEREQLRTMVNQAMHRLVDHYVAAAAWAEGLQLTQRLLAMESWDETAHRQQMRLLVRSGQRGAALAQYERCRQILADEFGVAPTEETHALYLSIQSGASSARSFPGHQADSLLSHEQYPPPDNDAYHAQTLQRDLSAIPQPAFLIGRKQELLQLETALLKRHKRLVAVVGLGGQGKSALVAHFAALLCHSVAHRNEVTQRQLAPAKFQRLLWYSCQNAPSLVEILTHWLQQLSLPMPTTERKRPEQLIASLFTHLQHENVLLVLDNFESFLSGEPKSGGYRRDHLGIEQLLERFAAAGHQGTLILISREQPLTLMRLAGNPAIAMIQLEGLAADDAATLLQRCRLRGSREELNTLTARYSGNPLALKIVAEAINELFASDLPAFLAEETLIVDDIRTVLDQQFAHLSALEVEIMLWLAIERDAVTPQQIWDNLVQPPPRNLFYEALRSLQRRFLIETEEYPKRFTAHLAVHLTLQTVVMEYITEFFVTAISKELEHEQLELFQRYLLVKAQAADYVRQTQKRFILRPLLRRLTLEWGAPWVEQRLCDLLDLLKERFGRTPGYAAANLLHLLIELGVDLWAKDFSNLSIWQADLRHTPLPEVNFTNADLKNSTFAEHFSAVTALAFSPDNRLLATATTDGDIHLWHTNDGRLAGICRGNGRWVWSLAFSPDGHTLVSGCADTFIRLWNLSDIYTIEADFFLRAMLIKTLAGHTDAIFAVAFSPDGLMLASGSGDATICLWQAADGTLLKTLVGHTAAVYAVAFAPTRHQGATAEWGLRLASAGRDGTVRLWHSGTAAAVQVLAGHTDQVLSVAFHPDGDYLLSGSYDQTVRLWEVATGKVQHVFNDARDGILAVVCAEDIVAAAGDDHTIYIWNIHTGKLTLALAGHSGPVRGLALAGDGYTLASGGFDQSIRLWDLHKGHSIRTYYSYRNAIKGLALHPTARWLANTNVDRSIFLWRLDSAMPDSSPLDSAMLNSSMAGPPSIRTEPRALAHSHRTMVHGLAFHPDGQRLASVGQDGMIRLWSVEEAPRALDELDAHIGPLLTVAFSPDGAWLATGGAEAKIALWHLPSRRCTHILCGHSQLVETLAFTPDAGTLFSGCENGDVLVWALHQLTLHPYEPTQIKHPQQRLQTATCGILALAISPDGQFLAVGGTNPGVELWDLAQYERVQSYSTASSTFALAFSPDDQRLAAGGGAHVITLWDRATAQQRSALIEHKSVVRQLIFTQDSQYLYSSGDDETICLWGKSDDGWRRVDRYHPPGLYRGLNIYGVTGINAEKQFNLRALGAIEQHTAAGADRLLHNIPAALTPLCGRTEDVALLLDKVLDADTRLITVLGEGGVGKTRVALEVARSLVGLTPFNRAPYQQRMIFADGVWFIPLSTVPAGERVTELLIATIAGVLDIPFGQHLPPQQQLFARLQGRKLLLILDNFEHLHHETDFLLALLQAAPHVKLLITSRHRLDLFVQVVYRLQGLAVPPEEQVEALTDVDLLHYPAIQLFVDQAKRVTGAFGLAPANRAAVVWLCRYVEGLPLGIKLAAAQLVDYAIDEVVARVKTDLSVLASTAADLPTHQRSLQAILMRSWADLPPPLAALLASCVVFEGSFCAEAAVAVAQGAESALHELANRSLLHIREDRRFVLHEFVRTFLYHYADAAPLVAQAAARHAAYYANLLDTKGRRKQSTVENFQLLARELPNLHTAWQWALQQPELDLLQQSIEGLFYTYERLGQFPEALHLVTQATATIQDYLATLLRQPLREQKLLTAGNPAELQGGPPLAAESLSLTDIRRAYAQIARTKEVLADLHLYTAIINEMMGDLDGTLSAANAAIALGLELGVPRIEARGYYLLALQAQQRGHFADATRWIARTGQLANDHNLVELQITALNLQGILHDMQGHHAAAIAHYKRALPLAIASNDHFQEKLLVNNLGIAALAAGEWEGADAHLQRNLILSEASGNPTKHTYALMNYALLLDAVGLYEQARQTLMHGLQIARTVRHRQSEVYILQFLALVGFHSGEARIAINYAEEALALIEEHQFFSLKAAALAFLAHNLLALDEMPRAMTYYTASIDLWRSMNNQLEIGSVLAGYGYAALRLGLLDQALACIEEILPMLDRILTDNATEAMWVVVACYFILQETNDERMYAVLDKGYQRLMQQTEALRNPEIRKAFLHNCYPHRVIVRAMQVYQSMGVSNGFSCTPT